MSVALTQSSEETFLLTEGTWSLTELVVTINRDPTHVNKFLYISHDCTPGRTWYKYWHFQVPCPKCGQLPPESLQGLWVLTVKYPQIEKTATPDQIADFTHGLTSHWRI